MHSSPVHRIGRSMSGFYNRRRRRSITMGKAKRTMKTDMNKKMNLSLLVKSHDEAIEKKKQRLSVAEHVSMGDDPWVTLRASGYEDCPMGARDANVIKLSAPVRGVAETELDSLKE